MSRMSTAYRHHRVVREHRRQEREIARALAMAPTLESRHEILSQAARL